MALTIALVSVFSLIGSASARAEKQSYIPLWMKPNSVIIYDDAMEYNVIKGGKLAPADIVGRADIAAVGFASTTPDMIASPNIKVEYDLHGFIQNIYYPTPGKTGEYQLSNPIRTRVGSGVIAAGTTYTYPGTYYNYDTQKNQNCVLTRSADGKTMTGTGRITFYTGAKGEGGTHTLVAYDCATKMDQDDVAAGTKITAKNTLKSKTATFYKYDVGSMPGAILDVWSNSSTNPIKDISNTGTVDNVYSASISHAVS